jgi:hypothetical protein
MAMRAGRRGGFETPCLLDLAVVVVPVVELGPGHHAASAVDVRGKRRVCPADSLERVVIALVLH